MAATDLERLVVQLSADITKYNNAMNKALGQTNKQARAIENRFAKMNNGISADFSGLAGKAAAAFAAIGGVTAFKELSDAATRIDNSLKVAGLSGAELEKVYQSLNKAAVENGAPLETLAELYSRVAQNQKELGASSTDLTSFTDNIALALRASGKSAEASSGALLQLGQALGGGTIQAEEYNSLIDGLPTVLQAAAAGLKEAGGSVAKLTALVKDGKVSSEVFFRAFEAGAPMLQEKVANSVFTIEQSLGNLKTALIDSVREFNNATGASESFAGGINTIAKAINDFDITSLINKIREAKNELDAYLNSIGNADVFKSLNQTLGATNANNEIINPDVSAANDKIAGLERDLALLQERIGMNTEMGFDNTEALARIGEVQAALASARAAAANLPATVDSLNVVPGSGIEPTVATTNGQMGGSSTRATRRAKVTPVSITDFKPPTTKAKSGGSGTKKESDYENEIQKIRERTASLQAETAAQALVNPLIDDYGYASTRATTAQELLTAAQNSGLAAGKELSSVAQLLSGDFAGLSPAAQAQAQSMLTLANGYAAASAGAENLQDSQQRAREAADEFKSTAKDVTSGFISDLRSGVSAADALSNALDKVVDKLLDVALNSAFGIGGGGGFLSLFGLKDGGAVKAYASGGKVSGPGGPRSDKVLARLSNGEFVVNAAATKKNRALLEALNGGLPAFANGGMVGSAPSLPSISKAGSGAGSSYAPTYVIDARGADQAAVARLERGLAERDATESKRVAGYNQRSQVRKTRA